MRARERLGCVVVRSGGVDCRAEGDDAVALDRGRGARDEYGGAYPECSGGRGDAESVIARACGDDTRGALGCVEQCERIRCAADFEGAGGLLAFELEEYLAAGASRERGRTAQRGAYRERGDAHGRGADFGGGGERAVHVFNV